MHAKSLAFVVHRTPTRIRIKIPGRQRQENYFETLKRVLLEHPDVLGVHANPLTASVVIECREGFDLTVHGPRFLGAEVLPTNASGRASGQLRHLMRLDNEVNTISKGAIGFAALVLKLIVAIATKQLGAQLIEWVVEAFIRAAIHDANRTVARRRVPIASPMLLVATAE